MRNSSSLLGTVDMGLGGADCGAPKLLRGAPGGNMRGSTMLECNVTKAPGGGDGQCAQFGGNGHGFQQVS
jgi:hypothetical protein